VYRLNNAFVTGPLPVEHVHSLTYPALIISLTNDCEHAQKASLILHNRSLVRETLSRLQQYGIRAWFRNTPAMACLTCQSFDLEPFVPNIGPDTYISFITGFRNNRTCDRQSPVCRACRIAWEPLCCWPTNTSMTTRGKSLTRRYIEPFLL